MSTRRRFIAYTAPTLAALGAARLLFPEQSKADQAPSTATASATAPGATGTALATATAKNSSIWAPLIMRQPPPTATPTATATPLPSATAQPTPTNLPQPTNAPTPTDLPLPLPAAGDGALLGAASGDIEPAVRWLVQRASGYTEGDIRSIVRAYQRIGDAGDVDWFLALAQMCLETGSLTSWWSQRPRRNPAGIGVTGNSRPGTPDAPPNGDSFRWAFRDGVWYEGVSFDKWDTDAIAAHIGRILAYTLVTPQTDNQRQLIDWALSVRPLSASSRGVAQTIIDLNGRWAVPGTSYGQSILLLRERMRSA